MDIRECAFPLCRGTSIERTTLGVRPQARRKRPQWALDVLEQLDLACVCWAHHVGQGGVEPIDRGARHDACDESLGWSAPGLHRLSLARDRRAVNRSLT